MTDARSRGPAGHPGPAALSGPAGHPGPAGQDAALRDRLGRLVGRSRWALGWEQAWPALWWPLSVLAAFVTVSWLGLWLDLPVWGRQAGLALFGLALLVSLWPAARLRAPARAAALDRLDRHSGAGHRPARTLEDSLALGTEDLGSRALWSLHLRRAEASVRSLRVAAPRPDMPRRDRHALRAAGLVAAAAAAFVAGPELGSRLTAAFDWRGPAEPVALFRVDGWIDPPLYTRLPPLMIDLAAGEQRLRAPVGSTLVLRMAGRGEATLTPGSGLSPLKAADDPRPELREQRYRVDGSTELGIGVGGGRLRLVVEAIPDKAPEIAISAPPENNARGTFTLAYRASDDYGLSAAEALVEKPAGAPERRSLVPAPRIALTLPSDHKAGEETRTVADLTDHAWAGARVRLTLVARDEAEQEGRAETIDYTLPQRPFTKPLAKALVEQRRAIVLDPDNRKPVQLALDALLIAPDRFTPEWGVFLGLKAAADRYRAARTDPDLTEVADWLWTMALQIEDGDLSDAERELRAAQERLREAIERNAPEQEIAQLTEALREAMDRFLREFAERMQREQQTGEQQTSRAPDRTISQDDLNRMLDEMKEAMRRGDVAEAQRLLEQLKNMMENLRTARPNSRMSDPMAREMNRQMEELDSMVREQQQLRDETFRQGQQRRPQGQNRQGQRQPGQRGPRQPGQQGQEGQEGEGQENAEGGQGQEGQQGLGRRQQALRERLQELQRRMRGSGMRGEQGLGEAEGAMKDAEGQIGQGRDGQAVDSQGRALEGLQRGRQGMAQQMQQMMGENGNEGEGEPGGPGEQRGRASNDANRDDPLGRPTRSRDFSDGRVRVPGANESAVERARRILEELRRKLGDPLRPRQELDYFERLLRRN